MENLRLALVFSYCTLPCGSSVILAIYLPTVGNNLRLCYQINGTRLDSPPTGGGANLEIGGGNTGQLVEYVKSFDPRSWSCLHVFEGSLNCVNTTIRYNDIGAYARSIRDLW